MPDDQLSRMAAARDAGILEVALRGLRAEPKTLPPKLFYDEEGCRLFYRITELPEYYLTRAELALLRATAPAAAAGLRPPSVLVEYGASDENKAGLLLDQRLGGGDPVFAAYVPVDVAAPALALLRRRLAASRPRLLVVPVAADFMAPLRLPAAVDGMARLGFFPGSTIGNLDPSEASRFLAGARRTLGPGARMLVGVDLRKDESRLVPAYDDSQGVTAAFNLNVLARLNREAGADFDLSAFAHRAIWNPDESRIEMHLVSLREQTVHLGGEAIRFGRGETIHTENSYKHTPETFRALSRAAGWTPGPMWTDPEALFSLHLLS